ncbi:MAG: PAS domain S-box protein [Elainella sp. Prado103]|nr:PAS domain S-box protein [Elainella sp. Prado103]
MKILVVEDDPIVAKTLRLLLTNYNYAVDIAADGETGLQMTEAFEYDLILLDLILPKLDGISLCQQLRSQGMQVPILLLTGQGEGRQKAIALNAGADDYVVKPFDSEELMARVQALLRRSSSTTQPILTWGDLCIDPSSRKATYGIHLLSVTPKEYAILELFLRNSHKVFSARAILDHVWNSIDVPSDEAVRVHIKEIRQKLQSVGAPKDFIKTVYQTGYRLNPLYSPVLAHQVEQQPTMPKIAELTSVNQELRTALKQLRVTQAALNQKNQELETAYQTIEQERQKLQAAYDVLESQVAERTAELVEVNRRLQERDHCWQALFDQALDAIVIADDNGRYIDANPAACQLFGLDKPELLQASLASSLGSNARGAKIWQQFLAQGQLSGEFCFQRPDGNTRYTEFAAIANFIPGRHLSILRDTSDRRQLELSLQTSESQLSQILDSAIVAIASFRVFSSQDWEYDYFSAGCEVLFGYTPQELMTDKTLWLSRVLPSDRDPIVMRLFNDFYAEQNTTAEFRFSHKDGSIRWISSTHASQKIADDCWRITVVSHDITDRKLAEIQLQEMSTALSHAVEGISQLDAQGRYIFVNQAYAQIAGYTPEAMIGLDWQQTVYPEDYELLNAAYQQMRQQGKVELEARGIRKDQSVFVKHLVMVAVYDEQRQFIGHYCFMKDISDRKQAEQSGQQQILREQLIADISQDIRRSLDLNEVLSRTVERIRALLNTDRVIIFRFSTHWQGEVIMESVGSEWTSILSTTVSDPCFREHYVEPYQQGRIATLCDIDQGPLEPCYAQLLKQFQVKACLVVPILQAETLWGLLIAHHCAAPRQWQTSEVELLRQLATNVGIAIQQSELYQQTRYELLERERMQAVLEESEERFRTLSTAAPIGICQTTAEGICLYTNARWQEISGLSFSDCLGDGWLQAIHPDDRSAFLSAWEAYLQGEGTGLTEFRLLTPQGDTRWVSARTAAMKSTTGEIIGYVRTYEDITDRKLAEQKIREQAALLDITSDAIFVRDLDHRILYWNQGAERLYGWQATEAIGQIAHQLLQNHNFQIEPILQHLLQTGEWQGEIHKVTKVGKPIVIEARWTLIRDEGGQPKFILSVDTDITDKKQLESQFYRAQRLESLGTLASGIAHDLNNVLTPILTISQLLRLQQPKLDVRSQEMLKMLEESAKRGANMVKQILTFTRGTNGERTSVQVESLLEEVIKVIQPTFPKSIAIRRINTHPLWLISADPTYLHQVLINLCVNARDAMPHGGILSLSGENYFVNQAFAQRNLDAQVGNYVIITIADTGTGIPLEIRDRIFEPFFTTKEPSQGTGLGLSTVLGIVKSYGGFLQVFSEVGQGTQVKVYLPATTTIADPTHTTTQPEQGQGELVLLVDDDPAIQQTNQALLESRHYNTLMANNGIEAIALYAKHQDQIKAVLIDVMMPNMDGITAVQTLHKINPAIKIIAISGLSTNREPVLAAGASLFLSKPYMLEDLLGHLQQLLHS